MIKFDKETRGSFYFFITTLMILTINFLFIKNILNISDEEVHCQQILDILTGKTLLPSTCPYLPGYHWSIAIISWPFQYLTTTSARLISTVLSFFCILAYFFLAKKMDRSSALQKAFLFFLCPIFFPFFSLIYTDIYSMFYVFLALWAALNKRLWLAGIFGILSIIVRQNNILWLMFIGWITYFENYYPQYRWEDVKKWLPKFSFFFLAAVLMIFFFIWNKDFVLGDRRNHFLHWNVGNVYFTAFIFFFLFLPQNLENFPKILDFLKRNKIIWLILIEIFLVYLLYFKVDHRYNKIGRYVHNIILMYIMEPHKIISFLPIAYSVLSLCVTRFHRPSFYLLYPFTLVFLLPLPVIEIRYSFIPIALFLLFKEKDSERVLLFTFPLYVFVIFCFMNLIRDASYFP
ncbi:MAG TPA: hypothetical protein PLO78_04745 [Candidatus Omnitrophota bacterium]|nr:hypothetical protein [Candidatus Omnitrophota bacterium]